MKTHYILTRYSHNIIHDLGPNNLVPITYLIDVIPSQTTREFKQNMSSLDNSL